MGSLQGSSNSWVTRRSLSFIRTGNFSISARIWGRETMSNKHSFQRLSYKSNISCKCHLSFSFVKIVNKICLLSIISSMRLESFGAGAFHP